MEKRDFRRNAKDMIYLTACVINNKVPDKERTAKMNIPQLFEVCQEHTMTACTAYALESAGIRDHEFTQAKEKAIRKNILLDAERKKILARLEKEKIWYMPLKGALLKDYYPKMGMRQMSDNDILCDGNFRKDIRKIMEEMGFTCVQYMDGKDDAYFKQPVYNFEMHSELVSRNAPHEMYDHYKNIKSKLIKDEGNDYGYHFSTEDFYVYLTAHEYQHFSHGGTGVRSLLDIYVMMQKFGKTLDRDYVDTELERLGLAKFERQGRELAAKLFGGGKLTENEQRELDCYIFSGTYGTFENDLDQKIENIGNGSKKRYVLRRIFPPMDHYKRWYPWAYKYKFLLPIAWLIRPIKGTAKHRKKLLSELRLLNKK
ncbi:MAG: nucleotidyltransferase family protein [Ruminococcus sp.]|nr:nucleotidyltransferase family protein [Ruminococcus sp.]